MKEQREPILKEIRRVRHEISAKFGHDSRKLVDHYIELQKKYADRFEQPVREPKSAEVVTK